MKKPAIKWLMIAQGDFESSMYLYKGAHYPQAIYFLCQAIEKLLKAVAIEKKNIAPQKIHRLENLAAKTGLPFSKKQFDVLTDLSKHYSRVRYPDISNVSYNTKTKTEPILINGKEMYVWIQNEFKNH
jgi:HEPN domain-containing protein